MKIKSRSFHEKYTVLFHAVPEFPFALQQTTWTSLNAITHYKTGQKIKDILEYPATSRHPWTSWICMAGPCRSNIFPVPTTNELNGSTWSMNELRNQQPQIAASAWHKQGQYEMPNLLVLKCRQKLFIGPCTGANLNWNWQVGLLIIGLNFNYFRWQPFLRGVLILFLPCHQQGSAELVRKSCCRRQITASTPSTASVRTYMSHIVDLKTETNPRWGLAAQCQTSVIECHRMSTKWWGLVNHYKMAKFVEG